MFIRLRMTDFYSYNQTSTYKKLQYTKLAFDHIFDRKSYIFFKILKKH